MHDLKALRADPAGFDRALARRGLDGAAAAVLAADRRHRELLAQLETDRARRNEASKEIGTALARGDGPAAEALKAEVAVLKDRLATTEAAAARARAELDDLLAALPNLPADDIPDGPDASGNVELGLWGALRHGGAEHDALAAGLGLDLEAAARIAGARFAVLKGGLARLHRALGQFMLDRHVAHGWLEVAPPLLVREEAMFGTAQLPKFRDDQFQTTDGRWLVPTAEVPLTNLAREAILEEKDLPLRFVALTPCFRREAGAAGRDTRGLIRQHQFEKVELVTVCTPDQAAAEHAHMLAAAEAVLQALGLAYRRVLLCAGDLGFAARRTVDLEVWLPGAGAFREISSVSWCGDFQARRMDARYRPAGGRGTAFVHTLNGSGVAVGRALAAVLETHQRADGAVTIPPPLRPYMGGLEVLEPESRCASC
ncbi:MAG: serine--tRNA ligase [Sphingomonadaceae bacterium]|uniref:serine--tRNA ligase n=1 Tax=Thermaurantiacus sp. TaxID=2820283 RepID=UPI00298EFF1E|nr:serine--tRNA ligase [Thermaurantiacus sp.]MCS6987223.1 serine--tRNA ligase [Sphingomonadaceae bacterium]MDW8414443.1 serine--tRNA ligase [Thermaurantiacus sp.]